MSEFQMNYNTNEKKKKTDANIDRSIKSPAVEVKKKIKFLQMYA